MGGTTALCVYFALAHVYGFGRAVVCLLTICLGLTSSLFFLAAYHSAKDEHPRNGLAAGALGLMIVGGSMLIGIIVFQLPPPIDVELTP